MAINNPVDFVESRLTAADAVKVTTTSVKFGPLTVFRGPLVPPDTFGRNGDIFIHDDTAGPGEGIQINRIPDTASLYQKRPVQVPVGPVVYRTGGGGLVVNPGDGITINGIPIVFTGGNLASVAADIGAQMSGTVGATVVPTSLSGIPFGSAIPGDILGIDLISAFYIVVFSGIQSQAQSLVDMQFGVGPEIILNVVNDAIVMTCMGGEPIAVLDFFGTSTTDIGFALNLVQGGALILTEHSGAVGFTFTSPVGAGGLQFLSMVTNQPPSALTTGGEWLELGGGGGSANGGPVRIASGNGGSTGNQGGDIILQTGDGLSAAGRLLLLGGTSTSGSGGDIRLSAGTGGAPAGNVEITAGASTLVSGGNITVMAGTGFTDGGAVLISSGGGNTGSGDVIVTSLTALAPTGEVSVVTGDSIGDESGRLNLRTGNGVTIAGDITIAGGSASTQGGSINLRGGDSQDNGGNIEFTTGDAAAATGVSGAILGRTGNAGDVSGTIVFVVGDSTTASAGNIELIGGDGPNEGSNIRIVAGGSINQPGRIEIHARNELTLTSSWGYTNGSNINLNPGPGPIPSLNGRVKINAPGSAPTRLDLVSDTLFSHGFEAPVGMTQDVVMIMPPTPGAPGQMLTTTTNLGNTEWQYPTYAVVSQVVNTALPVITVILPFRTLLMLTGAVAGPIAVAAPSIQPGVIVGQELVLVNEHNDTIDLLGGGTVRRMSGPLAANGGSITMVWTGSRWIEIANNA